MTTRDSLNANLSILAVYGDIDAGTTVGRSGTALAEELRAHGFRLVRALSVEDGVAAIRSDPLMGCVIVDAEIDGSDGADTVLRAFRARNEKAPTFLFGERERVPEVALRTLKLADEFL